MTATVEPIELPDKNLPGPLINSPMQDISRTNISLAAAVKIQSVIN